MKPQGPGRIGAEIKEDIWEPSPKCNNYGSATDDSIGYKEMWGQIRVPSEMDPAAQGSPDPTVSGLCRWFRHLSRCMKSSPPLRYSRMR